MLFVCLLMFSFLGKRANIIQNPRFSYDLPLFFKVFLMSMLR